MYKEDNIDNTSVNEGHKTGPVKMTNSFLILVKQDLVLHRKKKNSLNI